MATKAIVGEKEGMTQVWDDDNRVVPVTVLRVKPCRVVQVKTDEQDGYTALQVTFGTKKASKITKPKL
ncbi:MAG: 50S ribosomal protein L3, partial [Acidimicrobiales bacterium]